MGIKTAEKIDKAILYIYENTDNVYQITFKDDSGILVDLTGATIKATLKVAIEDTNELDLDIDIKDQVSNKGVFDLIITYANSKQIYSLFNTTKFICNVDIEYPSGDKKPITVINFILERSTTDIL